MALVALAALALVLVVARPAAASFVNGTPISVADGTGASAPYTVGVANHYPSDVQAFGLSGVITRVSVTLVTVDHTRPDDLNLLLVGPNGHGIQLLSDAGGAIASTGSVVSFADDGIGPVPDDGPLQTRTYTPTNWFGGLGEDVNFATTGGTGDVYPAPAPAAASWAPYTTLAAAFDGSDPNGTWSLYVTDDRPGETGAISSYWGLELQTGPAPSGGPPAGGGSPPPVKAAFSVARAAGARTIFDASASVPAGQSASGFRWDMNGDGVADASCPGSDPVMTTVFDASRQISPVLTVTDPTGASSVARQSLTVPGIASRAARAASLRLSLTRQTFVCAPKAGTTTPDLTDNGGPPAGCGTSVQFDLIDAIGCFTPAASARDIPAPEQAVLSRELTSFHGGTVRTSAVGSPTLPISAVIQDEHRQLQVSTQPVRINGIDFYPAPGAAIVLVPSVSEGLLRPSSAPALVVSSNATMKLGGVVLHSGPLRQPFGFGGLHETVHVGDFDLRRDTRLGDLPLDGSVGLDIALHRALLPVHLRLPALLGSVTGDATLTVDNPHGLQLDGLHLTLPHASVGGFGVDDLDFTYTRAGSLWHATADVSFPPGALVKGDVLIARGALQYLRVDAFPPGGIATAVPGVLIGHVGFTYDGRSGQGFGGQIGVNAGPQILTPFADHPCALTGVEGTFLLTIGDPVSYRADGDVSLLCVHLVHGYYVIRSDGYFELGGDARFKLADDLLFSANLKAVAQTTLAHAQIDVDVNVCGTFYVVSGCGGAEALVSDKGIGVCADVGGFVHVGGGVIFPDHVILLADSCGVGRFASLDQGKASTAAAGGPRSSRLKGGMPLALVAATGANGPPALAIHGPHGVTIHATASRTTHDVVVIQRPLDRTTYVFVRTPAAGTWTVAPDVGQDAISNVRIANGLPQPRVVARVAGAGGHRTLRYRLRAIPGQTVRFSERAAGVAHDLGAARGASGRLRFTPAAGGVRSRTIYATIVQDGLPRLRVKVASYRAPAPPRLRRPAHVVAKRLSRGRLAVSWRPVGGAARYQVLVRLSDGRRQLLLVRGRSVRVTRLPPGAHGTVTVRGLTASGRSGPATSARVRAVAAPRLRA